LVLEYLDRVRDNVVPLSKSDDVREALREWKFTDYVVDHRKPLATCELCDQQQVRYHFEIVNRNTRNKLLVGSTCILRYELGVYDKGELLDDVDARKKLTKLREELRFNSCLSALREAFEVEGNSNIENALSYMKSRGYLTPKYAFVVLWRLKANGIDHNPRSFKVRLRTDRQKSDLEMMSTFKVNTIWPALTTSQRRLAQRLGHPGL
jgi:hypothetical protein